MNDSSGGKPERCGFCAILGAPNAGKSTLVNRIVGSKISIVSHKVQTTRARLRAIYTLDEAQVVFVDTPGIFKPKRKLDEVMVSNAWAGAGDADAALLVVDCRSGLTDDVKDIVTGLQTKTKLPLLALNKTDLVNPEILLPLAEKFNALAPFQETFMISAVKGTGVDALRSRVAALMPTGPWLYPGDQLADVHLRFLAAETTREKIYERLHDELPYASTVETEAWEERKDGSVKISQVIFVERDSQKAIFLGKGGQTIKQIGQLARADLEVSLERRVHLFLFVKVRENWGQDAERFRNMGLEL
jgi:GTPase